MGDVIRPNSAVDDIFGDGRTTLHNARARGGVIHERAETGLGPVIAMVDAVDDELRTARAALAPLLAALHAENDSADAVLDRVHDETWNDVGRPAQDRYLALMYPGGTGYYTDGDTPGQPARMELLAKLYDRALHPKIPGDKSREYARRIREAAAALKADLDAAAAPSANVTLLERVRTALGRVTQYELANLKRLYKVEGLTEAQIHEIIPDRPIAKKAKP